MAGTEDDLRPATAADELATRTARGDILKSHATGREDAPRGVRRPLIAVLRPQVLRLANLHLTEEMRGYGNAWGRRRREAEARRRLELTSKFMADVG